MPSKPSTPSPPPRLQRVKAEAVKHPAVARAGFTTTEDGKWALKLWLKRGEQAPLKDLEAQCAGVPVVYDEEPEFPPVARPAYPRLGE
jgi:hypothetical protein